MNEKLKAPTPGSARQSTGSKMADDIIGRLQAQQPHLSGADELTERIVQSLPELPNSAAKSATLTPTRPLRRWSRWAASAAILLGLSAAAAIYHFVPKRVPEAPTAEEIVLLRDDTPAKPDFFVFDNTEMQQVAEILGKHYRLKVVFENKAAKHKRLYLKVEKNKTIQEVADLINNISDITVSVRDGKLVIK